MMRKAYPFSPFLLIFFFISISCARGPALPWKAIPKADTGASFDKYGGYIIIESDDYSITFQPVPELLNKGNIFEGEITLKNLTDSELVVLWEDLVLSDSYGFFKKYRFGQGKRVYVTFPQDNGIIPVGEMRSYVYWMDPASMKNARELQEYSSFTFKLPLKFGGKRGKTTLSIDYNIRENR